MWNLSPKPEESKSLSHLCLYVPQLFKCASSFTCTLLWGNCCLSWLPQRLYIPKWRDSGFFFFFLLHHLHLHTENTVTLLVLSMDIKGIEIEERRGATQEIICLGRFCLLHVNELIRRKNFYPATSCLSIPQNDTVKISLAIIHLKLIKHEFGHLLPRQIIYFSESSVYHI